MKSWEGDVRTGICEVVGCDDSISRVEAMEGVRNGDKCCADYGSLDGRKESAIQSLLTVSLCTAATIDSQGFEV